VLQYRQKKRKSAGGEEALNKDDSKKKHFSKKLGQKLDTSETEKLESVVEEKRGEI
jgi:hypothetical protein